LRERYDNLFTEAGPDELKYSAAGNFNSKWGSYTSLIALCDGQITKFNEVTQLPIHECLTFLSYKRDETVLIEAQYQLASQK
jgi:hypothetical protein